MVFEIILKIIIKAGIVVGERMNPETIISGVKNAFKHAEGIVYEELLQEMPQRISDLFQ